MLNVVGVLVVSVLIKEMEETSILLCALKPGTGNRGNLKLNMPNDILHILSLISDYWSLWAPKYWVIIGISGTMLTSLIVALLYQYTASNKSDYTHFMYELEMNDLVSRFFIFVGLSWVLPLLIIAAFYSLIAVIPFGIGVCLVKLYVWLKKK